MEKIHNLYITSVNKQGTDTNYNYNLYFSNYGIVIGQDEEAYLNIKTFQSLNSLGRPRHQRSLEDSSYAVEGWRWGSAGMQSGQ